MRYKDGVRWKKVLVFVGIALIASSCGYFGFHPRRVPEARDAIKAFGKYSLYQFLSFANLGTATYPRVSWKAPPCEVVFPAIPEKQRLHDSFVIEVQSRIKGKYCKSDVRVFGAAFDVKPEQQTVEIRLGQPSPQTIFFSILPKYAGKQELLLYGDDINAWATKKITVYEYPFVPPQISIWFPVLGVVFGSMLGLPWWLERREKRREQKEAQAKASAGDA